MPTPFIMPKFDMDQETATIIQWLKAEGDRVEIDEAVLVVETDKVSIEVPAPASGTLARIQVEAGQVVPVAAVIAYILAEGESLAEVPDPQDLSVERDSATVEKVDQPAPPDGRAATPAAAATPLAARMAQELSVDLSQVPASGARVTKEDVGRFLADRSEREGRVQVPATPAARRVARDREVDLAQVAGTGPRGRVQKGDVLAVTQPAAPAFTPPPGPKAEVVPLTGIRQTIADRMQASFQTAPHIALAVDADVTRLEAARARINELAAVREEPKVSLTTLLVRAVAWALARHPYLNAYFLEDGIHLWPEVNIGVATALPDGLIVPVIRAADKLAVQELNQTLRDLAARAREGRLTLPEVQGGTFTLSNLGMFGIKQFRAIINPPETAILAVGAVIRKPVVVSNQDEIAVRPIMNLTLSADHRAVDGVVAANFLADLVQALETPDLLLY